MRGARAVGGRLKLRRLTLTSLLVVLATLLGSCGRGDPAPDALIVYCAHDQVYAEQVLESFSIETGIPVEARYDTEATKSLGLTELIVREADHEGGPRADVFWNNQLLGTAELADRGLLEPYQGPGWQRIPADFKDPEGRYVGFGGRLRVWIVDTEKMEPTPAAIEERLASGDLSRVAMAKAIFGTTLSHMAVLWKHHGEAGAKEMFRSWRQRGMIVRGGNAQTKDLVAEGTCDLALTDTDDYFVAIDEKKPVAMVPVEVDGKAIVIPNTVAIVKGTDKRKWAERLVDHLASEEVERRLAASNARQLPLGPTQAATLPEQVRELMPWVAKAYPLADLVDERRATLEWLRTEGGLE